MLRKFKNIFWYAGVDNLSYERVKPKIQRANLVMTTVLSSFATLIIGIMLYSSFKTEGIKQNKMVYFFGLIVSLVILLLSVTIAKKHSHLITTLVYLSYSIYYLYGILIGAITDPKGKTVTFMVLLVFMPIQFIDQPYHIIRVNCLYVIVFIILCKLNKTGSVLQVDVIDAIVFGFLGAASGSVVSHMKIKGYVLEFIDQLTKMKNRNAYEVEKNEIPNFCTTSLTVLYIDVNGLHEVNNTKGHNAGDEMLQYIASEVENHFTGRFTFRIGGDEFVTFVPDKRKSEIDNSVKNMVREIEQKGYHVAVGFETKKSSSNFSLEDLIKEAEEKMYLDKDKYYKNKNRKTRK